MNELWAFWCREKYRYGFCHGKGRSQTEAHGIHIYRQTVLQFCHVLSCFVMFCKTVRFFEDGLERSVELIDSECDSWRWNGPRSSLVARRSWQAVERKNERHLHAIVEQKRSKIPQFVMRIYSNWNNNCNCYCNCKFITGSTGAQLPVPGTGTRVYSFSYRTSPLRFADCDSMLSNSRLLASTGTAGQSWYSKYVHSGS